MKVPPLFDANWTVAPMTGAPSAVMYAVSWDLPALFTVPWLADTDNRVGDKSIG